MIRKCKDYTTDVLIIGSGSAGLWAAHSVKKENPDSSVIIVDKGPDCWGGLMTFAGGDLDIVMPNEDIEEWIKDWVYYYDGLCDQKLMKKLFENSYEILEQYQKWGCEYLKDSNGSMDNIGIPQRGLEHIKLYVTKIKGSGGLRMTKALVKAIKEQHVNSLGRTLITDLIKNDKGRIIGAVGFNTIDGTLVKINAKAVLLATGMAGFKPSYMENTSTGEGIYMAFKAGAELRNVEFGSVWNVPKLFSWEGQTTLLPLGAKFVNAQGEDFMSRYSKTLGCNTDVHYITLGMAMEMRAGRGPIYFDTSAVSDENAAVVLPKMGWQYINYQRLKEQGIDFFNTKTEWMPQLLDNYCGLIADLDGATRVPGLYAAGRCRSVDPGVYTGGFALATTATSGVIAGKSMAKYIADKTIEEISDEEVSKIGDNLFAPMQKKGIPPKEVFRNIQSILFPYDVSIIKSETSLTNALHKIESLKEELLPQMSADDPHFLMKYKETEATAFIAEWYIKASLMRKESRCGHFREDYPDHKDDWLKWIVLSLENGKPGLHTVPVPIDEYDHKIEKYYQDNFKFL